MEQETEIYKDISAEEGIKYSPMVLNDFDRERHIPVNAAYVLVESQQDPYLSRKKLENAIQEGNINVYEFNGKQYLDRLDIGRVYHKNM